MADPTFSYNLTGATSDLGGPQNDPSDSLGGYCSTTTYNETATNLFQRFSLTDKTSSTHYRCICLRNTDPLLNLEDARILIQDADTYPTGVTIKVGIQTNDTSTTAPTCTDTTPPAGITFVSLSEFIDNPAVDFANGYKLGPLNSPADGATDIDLSTASRVFVYLEITLSGVTATLNDLTFNTPIVGTSADVVSSSLDASLDFTL